MLGNNFNLIITGDYINKKVHFFHIINFTD